MNEKEKEKLPTPTQEDIARLLESVEVEDWIKGSEIAARYVIAAARDHDPHLRQVLDRLALLENDVAEIATESWPLTLVEVERDLEHCLEDGPMGFVRFALDLVRNGSSGQLEWKPQILLCLARGRLGRGEGDAARLAKVVEVAEWLLEQARRCHEDDQKMLAWQGELKQRMREEPRDEHDC